MVNINFNILDTAHQRIHHLTHHCIVFHQLLLLHDDNKIVHRVAYNSIHMDLVLSYMAPIHKKYLQMAFGRTQSIVVLENLGQIPDNPVVFFFVQKQNI